MQKGIVIYETLTRMGNTDHWKKIAAVMLVAAIGIQPVYVQAKTREEIQQEREQKKERAAGHARVSISRARARSAVWKGSRTLWRKKYRSWIPSW